jgi:hypothetical protein
VETSQSSNPPFACNINGMTKEQRERYGVLVKALDIKNRHLQELSDGFRFELPQASTSIVDAAEWISYERLCCPFFSFSLELDTGDDKVHLSLRGPDGIKPFIRAEFEIV